MNQCTCGTLKVAEEAEKGFNDNVNGKKWGKDLTEEMSEGMTSSQSKSWIQGAAATVAGWISDFLHFSVPEKGPLADMDKSMPDMIDLMTKGIDNNSYKLENSAKRLATKLNSTLNSELLLTYSQLEKMTVKLTSSLNTLNMSSSKILLNYSKLQSQLTSQVINSSKTIFTTPQIIFNVQELDEAKLQQCFNYVNRKFGSKY